MTVPTLLVAAVTLLTADPLASLAPEDREIIEQYLPGVLLARSETQAPIVKIEEWWPLQAQGYQMKRTDGDGGEPSFLTILQDASRQPNSSVPGARTGWQVTFPGSISKYFDQNTQDEFSAVTELDSGEGVITNFDPAEPFLLTGIDPGTSRDIEISVKVYDIHDPKNVAHEGDLTCTYTDLGGWTAKVPAGTFQARLVKITYQGSVGPASIEDTTYRLYGQHTGPIAWINMDSISACLVYNKTDDYGCVLTKLDAASVSTATKPADSK